MLAALTPATNWLWITGNHDQGLTDEIGGTLATEATLGGIVLRHRARFDEQSPEISGHFHPRLTVAAQGRRIARPCAVRSERRLILPPYAALTGGMNTA